MKEQKNIPVRGMHCASCAAIIEKTLSKSTGVKKASVNYGTETAAISFDETATNLKTLSAQIEKLGYRLDAETGHEHKAPDNFSLITPLIIAGLSIVVMIWETLIEFNQLPMMSENVKEFIHHLMPVLAVYIFATIGRPYLSALWRFIKTGRANMDTLIGLGTGAAFLYSFVVSAFEASLAPYLDVENMYYDVTIVVITFISLGKFLESRAKKKTGDAIQKLLNLQAKTALVIRDGQEIEIPVEAVVLGDRLIIKPGAKIPVDGTVSEGESYVDESMVSGEPVAVEKGLGDAVVAGTINTSGSFIMEAKKIGSDTLLAHIIAMVEEAQASKAPIQALADKISAVFVPIVLVLAVLTFAVWLWFGTGPLGLSQALSYALVSFVGILVIACPCALGLATPTAIIVGVGKGARTGILIKDAATLQKLRSITTLVIDKTGTITEGKPRLTSWHNLSKLNETTLLQLLASLEKKSEHPLADAIVIKAKEEKIEFSSVENFISHRGKGVEGNIKGQRYLAGSPIFMTEQGLTVEEELFITETSQGKTPILLADEKAVLAIAFVADTVKPEAKAVVDKLHKAKIKIVMMTGDDERAASYIAAEAGIKEVIARALPEDKLKKIKALQASGEIVAMAGDGVNDAPALAQADVGIAMATGTDVAIESAGLTLLHGDISKIAQALRLSHITMAGIKQNLFWAFIYNIIGIPVAAGVLFPVFGILLNPIFAGLAMALSSLSVVGNSLRLKTKKL